MGPTPGYAAREPDLNGLPQEMRDLISEKGWNDSEKVKNMLLKPEVLNTYNVWKNTHQHELQYDAFQNINSIAKELTDMKIVQLKPNNSTAGD